MLQVAPWQLLPKVLLSVYMAKGIAGHLFLLTLSITPRQKTLATLQTIQAL